MRTNGSSDKTGREGARPNVILVMTDDQGYGDLGCTGNPWIRTPHIDRFSRQCTRLQDFHVSPLCTPTRGALMTGRYPLRNGAWATAWGRSILRRDEITMADVFAAGGYRTGMFGKWHLGDSYPCRPFDRGFQTAVAHKGGGVGQTPDFWGNNYFDDTYFHNGAAVAHEGYCTDIWFDEAMAFIEESRREPFFCYVATNAPHWPYRVAERYTEPYLGNDRIPEPAFYGMITNIDENMGRLIARLDALGLAQNTILIFMTDNGSSAGWRPQEGGGYNAGMRGAKGSLYDGGHRVPLFIRWPAGGLRADTDVRELISHVDLLPTFIELCGLHAPPGVRLDGLSVAPLLLGRCEKLPRREIFVQYRQNTDPPQIWDSAVLSGRWRLVYGRELYDIRTDPGQERDLAAERPDAAARLRAAHERWWVEVAPQLDEYCPLTIGSDRENPVRLDSMDVMGDIAWDQTHIRAAQKSTGRWTVDVERNGDYEFSLRRWPRELGLPIDAAMPGEETPAIKPRRAGLRIRDFDRTVEVPRGAETLTFRARLRAGVTELEAWFLLPEGGRQGAYYVYVERLG